ncbi:AAA domain-containing protein [Actinopolymorpha cephalotaxi]|uniref:AAA domain-containing protein n=1 Tax=Actinopolymorpha cephalotaxi TaxID=504797 RepID=A0A1I2WNV2_9ACTN|nr:AAA family ATPase [Actinopolymorpha cephalotaxi]NYH85054.1 DNA polymerase III delta prime subunit [Actinopolymorpha cephalotaxi]SFH02955.1 AAA domain-containing protein [Actinopolymorpha cephalotaxi]
MRGHPVPILFISGPPGVGKTTVAWEIFGQLVDAGDAPALVDLDLLGACRPVPGDDPYNERMKARNLGAMWRNYRAAGARCVLAAGVVESRDGLAMYADAVPNAAAVLCRLHTGQEELAARIVGRGRERGADLDKLTRRAAELSAQFERDDVADFRVDTDGRDVAEVARAVLAAADWLRTTGVSARS